MKKPQSALRAGCGKRKIDMDIIGNVLSKLKGVKKCGQGWSACCPAHDDKQPSLTVGVGDDGKVLLNCHRANGCPVEKIVAALGMQMSDLFPANGHVAVKPKPTEKAKPANVETYSADELLSMDLPEPRCAIRGIIPDGLSLLCGKPKLGKSWLALNFGIAVSTGGVALGTIKVDQGTVLYLGLEDTKRRLKTRLEKMHAKQGDLGADLHFARSWKRMDKGGLADLDKWIESHPNTRLVIVDTWVRFRPAKIRGADSYEEDYRAAADLKAVADKHGAAILGIHHCRKALAEDPQDEISGTLGLSGAADAIVVVRRTRGRQDATLFCTGRDIEEQELALRWDAEYCLWSILGQADEYRLSSDRAAVLRVLREAGRPMTPAEIAPLLEKTENAVKILLHRSPDWVQGCNGKYWPVPVGET